MSAILMRELIENERATKASFKNLTSGTSVEANICLTSCALNSCSFILPIKSCALGHQALLRINLGPKKQIEVTGKINQLEQINESMIEVTITLGQFVKEEWHALLGLMEKKQNEINALLKKLKEL